MIKNNYKISKLIAKPLLNEQAVDSYISCNTLDKGGLRELKISYCVGDVPIQVGQKIRMEQLGYKCVNCDKSVKKLFSGYCYPCLQSQASADTCITSPHLCHFNAGTCREPEWGLSFCYQPHYLYISFTDKFKIGLTRQNQIPTRWIDQGATAATVLVEVHSRHQAGVLEKALTELLGDRTHWQKMLKAQNELPNFEEFKKIRSEVLEFLQNKYADYKTQVPEIVTNATEPQFFTNDLFYSIQYPIEKMPDKITSFSLEKQPILEVELMGIKGQYLIFKEGVLNFRRHEGQVVNLSIE